jgi:hypothetical protein
MELNVTAPHSKALVENLAAFGVADSMLSALFFLNLVVFYPVQQKLEKSLLV